MEIVFGTGGKSLRSQAGGLGNGRGVVLPDDDVERGGGCDEGMKAAAGAEAVVEIEGGGAAAGEAAGEIAAGREREQLLGGPERDGGGAGAGALEADLAEVELLGGEVGVRGVVLVEAAHGGVAEEDAAAAVGLEAVLVGVDDDGVGLGDGVDRRRGLAAREVRG